LQSFSTFFFIGNFDFERKTMSALYILIAISLIVAIAFLIAFYWSVKGGQYEDDYTPSIRMLLEDKPNEIKKK
jgi:cbb3-type cytochrome oxidase maturation protein